MRDHIEALWEDGMTADEFIALYKAGKIVECRAALDDKS
jgi:hypothetical protein